MNTRYVFDVLRDVDWKSVIGCSIAATIVIGMCYVALHMR